MMLVSCYTADSNIIIVVIWNGLTPISSPAVSGHTGELKWRLESEETECWDKIHQAAEKISSMSSQFIITANKAAAKTPGDIYSCFCCDQSI